MGPGRGLPKAGEWFGEHKDARRAVAFVFVVHPLAVAFGGLDGDASFFQQLNRLLVHAQHRASRIISFGVRFQHLFHAGDELGVRFRWDDPILDHPFGHPVFFSV